MSEQRIRDREEAQWYFLELIRADLWFPDEQENLGLGSELMTRFRKVVDELAERPLELYRHCWYELGDRTFKRCFRIRR